MSQDPQTGVLRVNFDPALVRLLREVRYFLLLPDLPIDIPANATKVSRAQSLLDGLQILCMTTTVQLDSLTQRCTTKKAALKPIGAALMNPISS